MALFEGTYRLKRNWDGLSYDPNIWWSCTVTFDGLEVTAHAKTRRGSFRKGHRAMAKAVKLRNAIRSVKGLCSDE